MLGSHQKEDITKRLSVMILAALIAASAGTPVADNATAAAEVTLGKARGRVLMKNGSCQEGLEVYLHQIEPKQVLGVARTVTDMHGVWFVENIEPGKYIVAPGQFERLSWLEGDVKQVKLGETTDFGVEYFAYHPRANTSKRASTPSTVSATKMEPGFGRAKGVVRFKNGTTHQGVVVYLNQIEPRFRPGLLVVQTNKYGKWSAQNVLPGKYVITQESPFLLLQYEQADIHEVSPGKSTDFGAALWRQPSEGQGEAVEELK